MRIEGRQRLLATTVEAAAGTAPTVRVIDQPYKHLLRDLRNGTVLRTLKLGKAAEKKPEQEDGLNIEGLAATGDAGLLIGFRNPLRKGRASSFRCATRRMLSRVRGPPLANPSCWTWTAAVFAASSGLPTAT